MHCNEMAFLDQSEMDSHFKFYRLKVRQRLSTTLFTILALQLVPFYTDMKMYYNYLLYLYYQPTVKCCFIVSCAYCIILFVRKRLH